MEGSVEVKQGKRSNSYRYFQSYHSLQQKIKALLRCLAFGCCSANRTAGSPSANVAVADRGINMTTDEFAERSIGIRSRGGIKKPPKPHISSGGRGQIHSS